MIDKKYVLKERLPWGRPAYLHWVDTKTGDGNQFVTFFRGVTRSPKTEPRRKLNGVVHRIIESDDDEAEWQNEPIEIMRRSAII